MHQQSEDARGVAYSIDSIACQHHKQRVGDAVCIEMLGQTGIRPDQAACLQFQAYLPVSRNPRTAAGT